MSGFTAIDLSRLPLPNAIEPLDFETILAETKAELIAISPGLAAVLALESEPIVKILEATATRELLVRARVNDAVRAVLLATSGGSDLDNLAAFFGVSRLLISAGNPTALPPIPAVYEADTDLRLRTQLALEGYSVAGPRGAYIFHALSAEGRVKDVSVVSPASGEVLVTVLSTEGAGVPSAPVLAAVTAALNAEDVRPLCDDVTVQAVTILPFAVTAQLSFFDGPDATLVLAAANDAISTYVEGSHRVGRAIRLSAIYAALHQSGVAQVTLSSPVADIIPTSGQAAHCTAISITMAGA